LHASCGDVDVAYDEPPAPTLVTRRRGLPLYLSTLPLFFLTPLQKLEGQSELVGDDRVVFSN
jgi:hypothetical protein